MNKEDLEIYKDYLKKMKMDYIKFSMASYSVAILDLGLLYYMPDNLTKGIYCMSFAFCAACGTNLLNSATKINDKLLTLKQ